MNRIIDCIVKGLYAHILIDPRPEEYGDQAGFKVGAHVRRYRTK
jgi:hypothetical protein